jgi:phosphonate transport system ATP-binding protein
VEPILVCKDISTAYRPVLQRPILQSVSFSINPGEFVAVLGLNGAGKSTLLRALTGLVPLEQGIVNVQGISLSSRTLPQIRKHVGMLFQGGGLVPQLSALDNVLCGRLGDLNFWETFWGFSTADRRRALALLAHLGLEAQSYQRTSQLSGGQRQRVAIARALLQAPTVLLVDEPVTGLDVQATQQVMNELRDLHRQGMTVLAVLHDLSLAKDFCDRALVLEQGQIVYDGLCNNAAVKRLQRGLAIA